MRRFLIAALLAATAVAPSLAATTEPNASNVLSQCGSTIQLLGTGAGLPLACATRTTFSNASYNMAAADYLVAQTGTMSAARTVTLLAASTVSAGRRLIVIDESGTVTSSNTISLAPTGTDKINGSNTTQVAINAGYGFVELESDGVSNWTVARISLGAPLNVAGVIGVANGGTANATLTAHGLMIGEGTSATAAVGPCTTSQVIVGQGASADPACGSVPAAALPNPSASTLGGIESYAAVTHQWINTISTVGVPSSTQPAIGDISGWGTGVATALGNNTNSNGGVVLAGSNGAVPNANGGTGITSGASLIVGPATNVNFGSAGDNNISIPLPSGFTRACILQFVISGASGSITGATFQIWTAAGGTGTAVTASQSPTVSTASDNSANNAELFNSTNVNTGSYLPTSNNLFFRVGTTAAQTANVQASYRPCP